MQRADDLEPPRLELLRMRARAQLLDQIPIARAERRLLADELLDPPCACLDPLLADARREPDRVDAPALPRVRSRLGHDGRELAEQRRDLRVSFAGRRQGARLELELGRDAVELFVESGDERDRCVVLAPLRRERRVGLRPFRPQRRRQLVAVGGEVLELRVEARDEGERRVVLVALRIECCREAIALGQGRVQLLSCARQRRSGDPRAP